MLLQILFACAVTVNDYGGLFDDFAALLVPGLCVLTLLCDPFGS